MFFFLANSDAPRRLAFKCALYAASCMLPIVTFDFHGMDKNRLRTCEQYGICRVFLVVAELFRKVTSWKDVVNLTLSLINPQL